MKLNLYLICLAMTVGQCCACEGMFVKAEKFALDTKNEVQDCFMTLVKEVFMWFVMSSNLFK